MIVDRVLQLGDSITYSLPYRGFAKVKIYHIKNRKNAIKHYIMPDIYNKKRRFIWQPLATGKYAVIAEHDNMKELLSEITVIKPYNWSNS